MRDNVGNDDAAPVAEGVHQQLRSVPKVRVAWVRDVSRADAPHRAGPQPEVIVVTLEVVRREAEVEPVARL